MGFRQFTLRIRAILVMQALDIGVVEPTGQATSNLQGVLCSGSKQKTKASESLAWQRS